jgi:hypothetical protein
MPTPNKPGQADQPPDIAKDDAATSNLASHKSASAPLPDEATLASYVANNVPHCKKCGQQICSDGSGQPICPYEVAGCPVIAQ